eukprot:1407477-Amphidinium_carterae.1
MEELGEPAPRGLGEPALEAPKEEATEQQEAELPPPGSQPVQGDVPVTGRGPCCSTPRHRPTSCPAHRLGVPRRGGG